MSKNCAIPKRILAVRATDEKMAVVYSSIASAIRLNADLDVPWRRSGIHRAINGKNKANGNLYAGWFFTELADGDPIPEGAQIAIDLHPVMPYKMPKIFRNAPRVLVECAE